jgi:D-glycero-D-manno-heptose 1,7-bisphosphate phosphatase
MLPAIFIDRDGVICHNRADYVKRWDEFVFLPGALEALARLARSPFVIVIITNQSGINRGKVTLEAVEDIHRRMLRAIEQAGGRVDAIYLCPHRPDEGCTCRKPLPGLLHRAAAELGLDLAQSFLIGDALEDIQAACAAGCQPYLVLTGRGQAHRAQAEHALPGRFRVVRDLGEAVEAILRLTSPPLMPPAR